MHEVLRSMMEHTEWLVPIAYFEREELQKANKVSFGPRHQVPPVELWLFTEQATAQQAVVQGALLGSYVASVPGHRIFARLPADTELVRVNGGGFEEDLLSFERQAFPMLHQWANTLQLEASLVDPSACGEKLRAHHEFHVPFMPDGRMIAKPGHEGFAQPGVVCTSPDSYEAFVGALEPALAAQLSHAVLDGGGLRERLGGQEVDALYFNPFGPGRCATLPRSVVE